MKKTKIYIPMFLMRQDTKSILEILKNKLNYKGYDYNNMTIVDIVYENKDLVFELVENTKDGQN